VHATIVLGRADGRPLAVCPIRLHDALGDRHLDRRVDPAAHRHLGRFAREVGRKDKRDKEICRLGE
jgi:hypothetical protein